MDGRPAGAGEGSPPARARARRTVLWCTPRWRAIVPRRQPSIVARRRISASRRGEIMAAPLVAAAPTHEIVPDDASARLVAQGTVQKPGTYPAPGGGRWRTARSGFACRHADRARRRWGTLMRHAFAIEGFARTIGGLARGMALAASGGALVAPARLPGAPAPRRYTARCPAVAIAPVAPRAQVHHRAAQVADKPPAIGTQGQASKAWTPTPKPAMMALLGASAPGSRGRRGSCHRHVHRLPRAYLFPRFSPKPIRAHHHPSRAPRATMMTTTA